MSVSTRRRLIGGSNSRTLGRSALVLVLLFVPVLGLAQTEWTGLAGTEQWGDSANWKNPVSVPTNLTDVIIPSVPDGGLIFPDLVASSPDVM